MVPQKRRKMAVNWDRKWTQFCTSRPILCLQVEANNDIGGNFQSDVSEKSHNVVCSDLPAVRQVKNFVYNSFMTSNILDAFSYFISGTFEYLLVV